MIKKLKFMPHAQAQVKHYAPGVIMLQSYDTDIIIIEVNGFMYCPYGTFGIATKRHINAFCKEYFPNFTWRDFDKMYKEHYTFNYKTGEIQHY